MAYVLARFSLGRTAQPRAAERAELGAETTESRPAEPLNSCEPWGPRSEPARSSGGRAGGGPGPGSWGQRWGRGAGDTLAWRLQIRLRPWEWAPKPQAGGRALGNKDGTHVLCAVWIQCLALVLVSVSWAGAYGCLDPSFPREGVHPWRCPRAVTRTALSAVPSELSSAPGADGEHRFPSPKASALLARLTPLPPASRLSSPPCTKPLVSVTGPEPVSVSPSLPHQTPPSLPSGHALPTWLLRHQSSVSGKLGVTSEGATKSSDATTSLRVVSSVPFCPTLPPRAI